MKRRASASAPGSGPGPDSDHDQHDQRRRRRQPQTSCNFCRSKKLKCDRASPCSNCTSRGIPCDGQSLLPVPSSTPGPAPAPSAGQHVLDRLRRLEDAVFGPSPPGPDHRPPDTLSPSTSGLPPDRPSETDFDNGPTESLALDDCCSFTFRVAAGGEYTGIADSSVRRVDLPSCEDVLALLKDYVHNADFHVANAIHPPSVEAMVCDVYTRLRQGQKIDLGAAALIFGFCAAGAFLWDCDYPSHFHFSDEDSAAAQSHAWRGAAWDLLDQAQRSASNTLELIQARLILSDLIFNIEGTTSRFRYLQSCARSAAYEMRLHLVDLPGNESLDTPFLREMKRRVWWWLAATDWLLCTMGGATNHTYVVNPRHMKVNYPRNIASPDHGEPSHGPWSEASELHMNIRIRLGEISRDTVDALPLGSDEVDTLPYAKIAALDKRYEQLLAECPLPDVDHASADMLTKRIALQRFIGILAMHARRARLLRPLLQVKSMPERFQVLRKTCLDSTEAVIDLVSNVLGDAVDTHSNESLISTQSRQGSGSKRSPHRSTPRRTLVLNHLFMACAVLATDPSLRGGAEGRGSELDVETERRRSQLANACRLLENVGEKSPMAQGMVKRLVGVLRKHRVHGVERQKIVPPSGPDTARPAEPGAYITTGEMSTSGSAGQEGRPPGVQNTMMDASGFAIGPQPALAQNWAYGAMDPNGVSGIWNDFLGTIPTDNGWERLFADLDYLDYLNGSI